MVTRDSECLYKNVCSESVLVENTGFGYKFVITPASTCLHLACKPVVVSACIGMNE